MLVVISRFDESPTNKVQINGQYMKEYWVKVLLVLVTGNVMIWVEIQKLSFEEGVDSYVPYAGSLKDNVGLSLKKCKHTMCNNTWYLQLL